LSAVLGGTQSLHTNSMDEALSLPTTESVTIALRTQQVIAYETGVAGTVDPLAGSYFVEHLTDEIENKALHYIEQIDEMGGSVEAIERGYVQREIQDAAYTYQKAVESGERVVVGVNKFVTDEAPPQDLLKVDPKVGEAQARALAKLRAERDNQAVDQRLAELREAAKGTSNLMPYILNSVRNYATLGEICNTLREVFGEYQAPKTI
jgi:methylmalonyl-CoA mutase N-terminal domain/subunit